MIALSKMLEVCTILKGDLFSIINLKKNFTILSKMVRKTEEARANRHILSKYKI